jgi:hypothetical protein
MLAVTLLFVFGKLLQVAPRILWCAPRPKRTMPFW